MKAVMIHAGGGSQSTSKFPCFSSSPSSTCPSTAPNIPITPSTPSSSSTTTGSTLSRVNGNNSAKKNKGNNSSQNLRCPRCDSTNTKFCYYNNYNLTQPRHFCKTCRRYWTKGGTLRNVPIGGGCRKNKSTSANSASSALAKARATFSTAILFNGLNPGFLQNGFLDPPHPQPGPSPTLCASSPLPQGQTMPHILSLLRAEATHFPNPNSSPNPIPDPNPTPPAFTALKTEGTHNLGLDMYGNGAPSLLEVEALGSGNGSNILELYQKWKSSGDYNNYCCGNENGNGGRVAILGNLMGSSSSSSSPLKLNGSDALPLGGAGESGLGGYGIINSSFSSGWPEFPTVPINGTFP
ncbi:hypothetical protein Cgig2_002795 [Carnegiea gigantea]|uniref:Dof zinc finger protein n=1 Tax=Carnegiea gigantea TaxID=171969 RepID=A0A9Q1KNI5_9CARY|nr:hypothetical protein Cgig2_002795 [Carnegiea gigantea]